MLTMLCVQYNLVFMFTWRALGGACILTYYSKHNTRQPLVSVLIDIPTLKYKHASGLRRYNGPLPQRFQMTYFIIQVITNDWVHLELSYEFSEIFRKLFNHSYSISSVKPQEGNAYRHCKPSKHQLLCKAPLKIILLMPATSHMPPFVKLQQYHLEVTRKGAYSLGTHNSNLYNKIVHMTILIIQALHHVQISLAENSFEAQTLVLNVLPCACQLIFKLKCSTLIPLKLLLL